MRIRRILLIVAMLALGPLTAVTITSCQSKGGTHPQVIVIGFDGLDPRLCTRMMDAGELPNLAKLRQAGGYRPLGTSIPPQSPVAWASFITGGDPGTHGIFDFIHRDPTKQVDLYYSAAKTLDPNGGWEVGDYKIPLAFWPFNDEPGKTLLRREGVPFWDYLDEAGVPLWMYDIPANYPPSPSRFGNLKCLAGMGVPDLMGNYGTYQLYAKDQRRAVDEPGGMRAPLVFKDNVATAKLVGPLNTLLKKPKSADVEFKVYRDPSEAAARIELPDQTVVLKEGEWSDWCRVEFALSTPSFMPDEKVSGICRFLLQQVRPDFRLFVTPVNIDPSNPGEQKVSEPPSFVTDIYKELNLYSTLGFQESYKALSNQVFSDEEYLQQATFVLDERLNLLGYALRHYRDGLLFFYFSSTDLQAHMFWWDIDYKHPTRSPEQARHYNEAIAQLYRKADGVVGDIVAQYGDRATILVMSDHGFCNFARQFNLNTWLRDNGYIQPPDCDTLVVGMGRRPVDWSRTQAYSIGLNGLYLNLKGRERDGIVDPAERDALLEELRAKLVTVRDPQNDQPAIGEVYRTDQVYHGPFAADAPDLIVGYHRDYRAAWSATLGGVTKELFSDNDSAWSADHCIAAEEVPGVIFSNRPVLRENPSLVDLAPTILEEFGVPLPETMKGGNLFKPRGAAVAAKTQE